jgi:preprotein translocase subunit YajC
MTLGITAVLLTLWQAPPAGGGGGSTLAPLLFQFGLIFVIFYFLIIRPQQRQRKQHDQALRNLKRGDRIVTAGGLIGEVIHIKESMQDGKAAPSMDDEVTIKSGESRFVNERGRIAKIVSQTGATSEAPKSKRDQAADVG